MNDPSAQPIDVEEQRRWIQDHKAESGLSWKLLGGRLNISHSTLSLFAGNNYNAPGDKIAETIFRYRQTLTSQAALRAEAPEIPTYFPTETSNKLIFLLHWAQRGRIVTAALGAGLGKTTTAKHFQACNANVFMATCSPSSSGLYNMQHKVLRAMGDLDAGGNMHLLTERVLRKTRNLDLPLLIIDEAQHLTERAIEEIRHWHDETGIGVALFGNEEVQQRIDGGSRSAAFAQIFSRVSMRLVRSFPLDADVEAVLEAWRVHDQRVSAFIHQIARKPGGLRGATFTLELAMMLAMDEQAELSLSHVEDAWAQLSSRAVRA